MAHGSTLQKTAAEPLFGDTITIYTALCEQAASKPGAAETSKHGSWLPTRSSACATTPSM
ncbi:hypothetical protein SMG44B_20092 [Stenotrophomonas maltophilia]|nr:hypothetical protein BN126310393 [Stenotrophomonas maltophilia]